MGSSGLSLPQRQRNAVEPRVIKPEVPPASQLACAGFRAGCECAKKVRVWS